MAHIKISRNDAGNCINFIGTTNPAYWNACLSAEVNANNPDNLNIINDIRTTDSNEFVYEFFDVPYTDFSDKDGNDFADVAEAVAYINDNANVSGNTGSFVLTTNDTMSFKLDDTTTSIIFSNGDSYGVNTIKASNTGDGLITISQIGDSGRTLYTGLEHTNAQINSAAIAGGLNDVINALNELFTVGPFNQIVITDPYSTLVADVSGIDDNGSIVGSNAIDPIGDALLASSSSHYNRAGYVSEESLNQAGEYFTFDIRVTDSMGFGFILDQGADKYGVGSYADPDMFCNDSTSNSANWGYYWSHWFHSGNKGPWTYYGQRTSSSLREGWSGFGSSEERTSYINDNPIKMKVGIDANGYMEVAYYDVSESSWVQIQRASYVLEQGETVKLGIKVYGTRGQLYSRPKKHLLADAAPTLYFRYIESPDGNFEYPLFATQEEANYYDANHSGTTGAGESHTHTYDDDPTSTTWYMPTTGSTMTATSAPTTETFMGVAATYTEITSMTNADLSPAAFSLADMSREENTAVNIQINPQDVTYTTTVDITPAGSGLVFNGTYLLQGTLNDVGSDTEYTITVTRANAYGSSVGSFKLTATHVAPVASNDTLWTKALDFSGSNERITQVSNSQYANAMRMGGYGTGNVPNNADVNLTSASGYSMPWFNSIVFKTDRNSSNQHIWNLGQGGTGKNIYIRTDASGNLYFGWGHTSNNNECEIAQGLSSGDWYGVYIAHKGGRFSYGDLNTTNLADAFDIRLTSESTSWAIGNNLSTTTNWTAGGNSAYMSLSMAVEYNVGGRGTNRNFHGKVASNVISTLKTDTTVPDNTEIEMIIKDPVKWLNTYKVGQAYRYPNTTSTYPNFQIGDTQPAQSTQVWLMGDGASDSYANGMRNYVAPADTSWTKLQLNSMVSNDIETVNINGLT